MKKIIFLVFCLSSCLGTKKNNYINDCFFFSKDSLTYCQSKSPWVANCYTFYFSTSQNQSGYFEKKVESDDGQFWWGKGRFHSSNDTVFLSSYILIRCLDGKEQDSSLIAPTFLLKRKNYFIQSNQNAQKINFTCQPGR
jgi:hypothetical protein